MNRKTRTITPRKQGQRIDGEQETKETRIDENTEDGMGEERKKIARFFTWIWLGPGIRM